MAAPVDPNAAPALITNDAVVLGMLVVILGFVFWSSGRTSGFWKKFYGVVPALLLCYFLPALLNSFGIINGQASGLYPMARDYLLPAALVLLCVAIDFKGIVRLGPKAVIMFFTGTVGVQPLSSPKASPDCSEMRQLCSGQETVSPWTMPWLSGPALCGHLLTSA